MVSVDGLTVEFGGSTLFSDISFVINEKDRIALMGKNGAGKSTLLKILAGVRTATRGQVSAPKDTVIAFTYKVVVNKVDENKKPLAGAEFTLEKYDAATQTWVAIKKVETEAGSVFTFKGLDDGNYRLTETVTPDGYNSIEPIEFTVTASHDIEWETQDRLEVLNSLTGDAETGDIEVEEINEIKFTPIENNEGLTTDVINQSGVLLPETGGIGTTIFYIVGGLLAVGAVILLVTKKRMATAE